MAHANTRYRQARYAARGPVPQDVIEAVAFTPAALDAGEVLVEVLAAPINPSDVLTLDRRLRQPAAAAGGGWQRGRRARGRGRAGRARIARWPDRVVAGRQRHVDDASGRRGQYADA